MPWPGPRTPDPEQPYYGRCGSCGKLTAATSGPLQNSRRTTPASGYLPGYLIEQSDRHHLVCRPCLDAVVNHTK